MVDLLFGVSPDHADYPEVSSLVADLDPDRHIYAVALSDDEIEAKLDRLAALVQAGVERARRRPRCPEPRRPHRGRSAGALTDPGIIRDFLFETINTRDDTAGLLMWVLKFLADDADLTQRLRAAGDEQRASPSGGVGDVAARPERVPLPSDEPGHRVPGGGDPGAMARPGVHQGAAPGSDRFEHAGDFDPDRFAHGGCGRDVYAPFGIDQHACIGESLTRTTARVFATLVAGDHEWETARDGPVEMSIERHWAPSSRWRVAAEGHRRADAARPRALARR